MKQKLLLGLALFAACTMASAQDVPVADLLDVQFNGDGTAVDISPMENEVTFLGDGTVVEFNTFFGRNVPKFGNTWGSAPAGAYHVDFENNQAFRDALADGHSLEMLVSADYQGTIANSEAKPFSAMQGGGTGFLVTTISGSRQNEWCCDHDRQQYLAIDHEWRGAPFRHLLPCNRSVEQGGAEVLHLCQW